MMKLKGFLKEYRYAGLSFLLSLAIFIGLLARIGIFPFGPRTLFMSDMNSIYADFLAEYQRALQGNGSFLYSFHAGLGLNFLAIIAFYLPSPFNWLLAAIPEKNLADGITLITTLKISLSALTFSFFLKKHLPKEDESPLSVAFAVLYSLMGYSVTYLFNMIWLDGVILLPLIFYAIDLIVRDNRWIPAVLLYALLFLSNFYIGYMVGIFSALYFLANLFCLRQSDRKVIGNKFLVFTGSVLLAAALNAVLLIPTGIVLKENMGLFGQTAPHFESKFPLFDLFLKSFPGIFDGYKDSLPQIYCGILTILCLPYYFFNRSIQKREKLCSLLIIILMIFSFNLSPFDFFWHAFDHPSWFPYRYAFLFSFYLLFLGYQGIVRSESTDKRIIFLSAFGMIFYLILVQKISPATLDDQTFYIGLMFILIDGFILFFGNAKKPSVAWLLVGLCMVETAWNADSTLQRYVPQYSLRTELVDFRERNLSKIRSVLPPEGKFYRVEKTEIRTYNDAMLLGYPGIGNFSSVANLSQSTFLKKLGFDCYATWCTYQGRTIFSDSLLGIRFIVSDDPLNYYSNYSEDIYENPYAFPPAFYSQSDFNTFPTLEPDDPILLQNGILNALMGSDKTWFEEIDLQPASSENLKALSTDESRSVFEKIDPEQPASIRYLFTIPDEQPYTLFIPNVSLNYDIWLNGEQIFDDNKNYTPFLIDLDKYQAGDKIEILIDLAKSTDYSDEVRLFSLDLTEFANAAKIIQTNAPQYVFNGKTVFKFAINPSEQDRYLLTSVSYDPGWQATIDGKKVPTVPVMGSLIGIKIPAGSKELILSFRPKGLKVGAGISLVSLILFLMEVFLYGKKKQEPVSD